MTIPLIIRHKNDGSIGQLIHWMTSTPVIPVELKVDSPDFPAHNHS